MKNKWTNSTIINYYILWMKTLLLKHNDTTKQQTAIFHYNNKFRDNFFSHNFDYKHGKPYLQMVQVFHINFPTKKHLESNYALMMT